MSERYIVESLTGYRGSQRKPTISWSVYDTTNNYHLLASYHSESDARAHAERLNRGEENVREHRERLEDEQ